MLHCVAAFCFTRLQLFEIDFVLVCFNQLASRVLLELCQSVPVDIPKDLKTSSQKEQKQRRLAINKRIEQLGGELPMNWLECELIYLERFAQKLQRILDRQVIGF